MPFQIIKVLMLLRRHEGSFVSALFSFVTAALRAFGGASIDSRYTRPPPCTAIDRGPGCGLAPQVAPIEAPPTALRFAIGLI